MLSVTARRHPLLRQLQERASQPLRRDPRALLRWFRLGMSASPAATVGDPAVPRATPPSRVRPRCPTCGLSVLRVTRPLSQQGHRRPSGVCVCKGRRLRLPVRPGLRPPGCALGTDIHVAWTLAVPHSLETGLERSGWSLERNGSRTALSTSDIAFRPLLVGSVAEARFPREGQDVSGRQPREGGAPSAAPAARPAERLSFPPPPARFPLAASPGCRLCTLSVSTFKNYAS